MAEANKTLHRTLSSSNLQASQKIHEFIKVQQDASKDHIPALKRDVTKSSMILPAQYTTRTLQLCVDAKTLQVKRVLKTVQVKKTECLSLDCPS